MTNPSTSRVIHDRLAATSRPGERTDPYRVGLAVEGGGMRGVISAGMLLALEQLGMRDCFDLVVGTSAGAISSAFFVTGKATEGSVMFYTDLNSEPFLDRRRLLRRLPAVDLDYLLDTAVASRGLVRAQVAQSPIELHATVCPVDPDDDTRVLVVDGGDDRIAAILSASANLPVLAGGNRLIDGQGYVDGGLHEQCPWRTCASLDATHVLTLPSRPVLENEDRGALTFVERLGVIPLIRKMHGPHIADLVSTLPDRGTHEAWSLRAIADGVGSLLTHDYERWDGDLELVDLPESLPLPGRLETSRPRLVDAMIGGAQAIIDHFKIDGFSVEPRVVLHHGDSDVAEFRSESLRDIVRPQHAEF
jgi:predicted patatin/cPLA2 family phospholipase